MKTALHFFAEQGYTYTSTKLIAKEAGVSEALIFKHFTNKDQLLHHLIKSGYRRILINNRGMLRYENAKEFVNKIIDLPKKLVQDEYIFWKLQERLSYLEFSKQQHEQFMKPVYPILKNAFEELEYKNPALEASLLLMMIDMLWKKAVSESFSNMDDIILLIKEKYLLNK